MSLSICGSFSCLLLNFSSADSPWVPMCAGDITVWFPEGERNQVAWFTAVKYQPVKESSRALLVIPRRTLYSEKQWEETNVKLKKKMFPQLHKLWFTFPAAKCLSCPPHCLLCPHPLLCPHGHDEALEMKSSVTSSPQNNTHRKAIVRALLKGLLLPLSSFILE